MPNDVLRSKVVSIALQHAELDSEELLGLLEYEWDSAGLAVADRGPAGDYVRTVVERLWREMQHQSGSLEVAAGIASDHALQWAAAHGLASDQYAIVVGLLAAAVVRAVLGGQENNKPPGPDGR